MVAAAPREVALKVRLRNGNWDAFRSTVPELLVEGPARTGKTFALLLRMVKHAQAVAGYRGLIVRKVAATLGSTILRTLEEDVLHEWENSTRSSALDHVHFFGGSQNEPASYEFANGSRIVVGGMDQASKVLGSEYDEIYANEVIEFSVEDIETLLSRLSHGLLPDPCFLSDCNPTYDRHWVLQRALSGQMKRIKTTLKDNPAFYDDQGEPTARGLAYLQSISGLTGTRYQRLVLGEWVGMENAIYGDLLDAEKQLLELTDRTYWTGRGAGGMDYGRIHLSAVCAVTEDSEGYLWVRECWAEPGGGKEQIKEAVRSQRLRFKVTRGVTDPIQEWAAQELGWTPAKSGAGSRKGRIERVRSLLEADVLRFDRYGEGISELWDELNMYRYEVRETDTVIEDVVVRKDDDRVAALEYAIESWETKADYSRALSSASSFPAPRVAR